MNKNLTLTLLRFLFINFIVIINCCTSKSSIKKLDIKYLYNGNYEYPLNELDSIPFRVKHLGDTTIYWTHSAMIPFEIKEYSKELAKYSLDSMAFPGPPSPDNSNRPTIWYVQPDTFLKCDKGLYLINNGKKELIFDFELLNNEDFTYNREIPNSKCGYTIYLTGFWILNSKRYFSVYLIDPCLEYEREQYTFDENFNVIEFGSSFTNLRHYLYGIKEAKINDEIFY